MSQSVELLRIEGVRKTFPGVVALDSVDFDLRSGEVHVLLGENGAGKSTLIKMLSGAYRPDSGTIFAGGEEVRIDGAEDAERLGIATIYQEFNLVPDLTVAENIFLGRQPRRFGMIDRRRMEADAEVLLDRVGLRVSPRTRVRDLGIARLQMVEIAKALSLEARVLIMDEPTAVLTSEEVDKLFRIVRQLREDGVGIVFITHHLDEIAALGDRVTVLRDGRSIDQVPASTPEAELVQLMVGRSIDQQYPRERTEAGEPLLSVRGLTRNGVFHDVSFDDGMWEADATSADGKPHGGLQAISQFMEANVPESERDRASEVLIRILNGVLFDLAQLSREKAGLKPLEPGEQTLSFMTQAVFSLSDAQFYPAPMAFMLEDFKQVQASVFQVARAPGKNVVYFGCALLILGVFAMLYVRDRRLWVWITPAGAGSQATMALSTNRKTLDTDREFAQLAEKLIAAPAATANATERSV